MTRNKHDMPREFDLLQDPQFNKGTAFTEKERDTLGLRGQRATGVAYNELVANGSLDKDGQDLPLWSMVVVELNEDGLEIRAGKKGLEALVLQFPHEDE